MSGRPLTVEIFQDTEAPGAPVEPVAQGIKDLVDLGIDLEILRDDRRLRIGDVDGMVDIYEVKPWPRFAADMNIVATTRPMTMDPKASELSSGLSSTGQALTLGYGKHAMRIAAIRSEEPVLARSTTSHEIAHLLHVYPEVRARYPATNTTAVSRLAKCIPSPRRYQCQVRPYSGVPGWLSGRSGCICPNAWGTGGMVSAGIAVSRSSVMPIISAGYLRGKEISWSIIKKLN